MFGVKGHDDPEHDVDEQTGTCEQNAEQPDGAYESGIEVEVAGDAGTDAGDFLVGADAGEGALGNGRQGRDTDSAELTEDWAFTDVFAAICAVHGFSP